MLETIKKLFDMQYALNQELVDYIIIYLRKSRKDTEFGNDEPIEKTLERHEKILQDFAINTFGCKIPDKNIYREVVSGDNIEDRPEMQKVLQLIESDKIKGVLVVEIERLARGNTIDQGIIVQRFQLTTTRIIVTTRVFNLDDEFDLSYFEDSLYQSRKYLQYIKRILARGREQAAREGKCVTSTAKYGYTREKLVGEKGYTMIPNENSKIIRKIVDYYLYDGLHPPTIANKLNELGLLAPRGGVWTPQSVRNLLKGWKVYAGHRLWNQRKTVTTLVNGEIKKTRPINPNCIDVVARHEPIITWEEGLMIKEKLEEYSTATKVKNDFELKNPLAGLIRCSKCGQMLMRHISHKSNHEATLVCRTPTCKTPSSYLDLVEDRVLKKLKEILQDYENNLNDYNQNQKNDIKKYEDDIKLLNKKIDNIHKQKIRCCELLETNLYDEATFKSRIESLNTDLDNSILNKKNLEEKIEKLKKEDISNIVPNIKTCLNLYKNATIEEKNELLSAIIDVIYYSKEKADRWGNTADKFVLEIKLKI